jgi:hypothetical protein
MFLLLILASKIRCDHDGKVANKASQEWAVLDDSPILRNDDPEGRDIDWCPNRGANIKYCDKTLKVETGYSKFVTVGGKAVVIANLAGKTNGTPPGAVFYRVRNAEQTYVTVES